MAFLNFTCPETRQQAPTSIGHGCRESARGMVKNDQCCEPFATGAGKQLMTMETSGLNIWGSSVAPLHRREATGDRPAEVIHRLGWPQS